MKAYLKNLRDENTLQALKEEGQILLMFTIVTHVKDKTLLQLTTDKCWDI